MKINKSQRLILYLPILVWLVYFIWWLGINFLNWPSRDNYTDSYSLVALTGSISGFIVAKKWGLFKSRFGKALGFFAIGLFLQFLGQFIFALYFRIGHIELAFPSIGDVPYLLSNVAYIVAVYNLLKVIVYKGGIFKPKTVLVASTIMTLGLVWLMYISFLHLAIHDERGAIYSLVNGAYPFIQAFYFLLGLVALMQAKRMAGGKMLFAVTVMLVALIVQYAADFSFLYQDYHDMWQAAASNDLVFVTAYGLMALAILMIDRVRRNVVGSPVKSNAEATAE